MNVGEAIIVRHVRNGVELPPIDQNLYYDFDYQLTNHITPRIIKPVSVSTNHTCILSSWYYDNDIIIIVKLHFWLRPYIPI